MCFLQHGHSTKSQCGRSYVTLQRLRIVQRPWRKSREAGYDEYMNDGMESSFSFACQKITRVYLSLPSLISWRVFSLAASPSITSLSRHQGNATSVKAKATPSVGKDGGSVQITDLKVTSFLF